MLLVTSGLVESVKYSSIYKGSKILGEKHRSKGPHIISDEAAIGSPGRIILVDTFSKLTENMPHEPCFKGAILITPGPDY